MRKLHGHIMLIYFPFIAVSLILGLGRDTVSLSFLFVLYNTDIALVSTILWLCSFLVGRGEVHFRPMGWAEYSSILLFFMILSLSYSQGIFFVSLLMLGLFGVICGEGDDSYSIVDGVYKGPERFKGDLDLEGTQVTDLGALKSVSGYLNLSGTPVTSLGALKSVSGGLYLRGTQVTSLGALKSVGGSLDLWGTPIRDLGSLESVGGSLVLEGTQVTNLGVLKHVGGYLDLRGTQVTSLGGLKSVGGHLDLEGTPITSLGVLQSVGGWLELNRTPITSLGVLESVGASLDLKGTQVTSLGVLRSVGGKLYLPNTHLTSLGALRSVNNLIYFADDEHYTLKEHQELISEFERDTDPMDYPLFINDPRTPVRLFVLNHFKKDT